MIDSSILLTFAMTVATFLILPGPVNLVVANSAVRYGMKGAFWSIVGTNLASLVLIALAGLMISGVGVLNMDWLEVLTCLGGFYLIYYAGIIFKSARELNVKSTANTLDLLDTTAKHIDYSPFKLLQNGFLVGISNPKDVVFFMSFFPPFITQLGLGLFPSLLLLTLVWCVLDYVLLGLYGMGAKRLITPKVEKWVLYLCSIIFTFIGLYAVMSSSKKIVSLLV